MNKFQFTVILALLISISACKTIHPKMQEKQSGSPALITNQSKAVRDELTLVVSKALNRKKVLLAEDVLTRKSTITITRTLHKTIEHSPVMGRSDEKPHRFDLVKIKGQCFLLYQQTDEHYQLRKAKCKVVEH